MKLRVKNTIEVKGQEWDFGKSILDAALIENTVVIVFDYMDYDKNKQARNLEAFDLDKNRLWVAEHPTNQSTDAYVSITSEKPLKLNNFASYDCEIDLSTGKLIDAVFYK